MAEILTLNKETVLEVLSGWIGIPVEQLDPDHVPHEKLTRLEIDLKEQLFGQDAAIDDVCKEFKGRFSFHDISQNETGPISTLMFVGPSGSGKTELSRQIARHFFGSYQNLVRIDCGNYSEEHAISKLVGAPPGYVGFGEGGQLTNALHHNSFVVILFDEIEKAHPRILTDVLLQLCSYGTVTDGNTGALLDASNAIVILTSNIGTSFDKVTHLEFGFTSTAGPDSANRTHILSAVHSFLPNEVLGRINRIIVFNNLDESSVKAIWRRELEKLQERLSSSTDEDAGHNPRIQISITDEAEVAFIKKSMAETNYQGARAIQRVFNHWIADQIAELKTQGTIPTDRSCLIKIDIGQTDTFSYSLIELRE